MPPPAFRVCRSHASHSHRLRHRLRARDKAGIVRNTLVILTNYDLSTDLAESKNVYAEHPEEVARRTKLLDEIIANGRSTPGADQANDAGIRIRKKLRNKAK